jgi:hypothetical protein
MPQTYSRRDILKLMGVAPVAAATAGAATSLRPKRGPGPKLFISADDLPMLRRRWAEDPRFSSLREGLTGRDRVAMRAHLASDLDYRDPLRVQREIAEWAQEQALVYLMAEDEDAGQLAIECMRTAMRFPYWDFFLDGPDQVIGVQRAPDMVTFVACVVDWLGDLVEPAERQEWLRAMGEKGCEPCHHGLYTVMYPREAKGWRFNTETTPGAKRALNPNEMSRRPEITQDMNLRAHPAGALATGVAAMACYGDDTSQVERWLEMAVTNLKAMEDAYEPDGSYGEGVGYGSYTSRTIIMGLEALRHSGLMPLELAIDWLGNVRFMLNMAMPTAEYPYEIVNIGDNGNYHRRRRITHLTGRPEMRRELPYWVARTFGDGEAQWFGDNLAAAEGIWSFIYRDDSVKAVPPPAGVQHYRPHLDWMVTRTGFAADDLVVSLRSGCGHNHEHSDRNSLIVKCHGEQLIVDPLRPPYNYEDPSWLMRLTAGHSAVLVDGQGQLYNNGVEGTNKTICMARMEVVDTGPRHATWVSNATQAYRVANADVRSVVRAVVTCHDLPAVIVVDRVTVWKKAAPVEARFFADNYADKAQLSTTSDGFRIERPQAWAEGTVWSRDAVKVAAEQLPIAPERAPLHPYVGVTTAPTMATTIVTVIGLGRSGETGPQVSIEDGESTIDVTLRRGGRVAHCRIDDSAEVPELSVKA